MMEVKIDLIYKEQNCQELLKFLKMCITFDLAMLLLDFLKQMALLTQRKSGQFTKILIAEFL